MKHIDKSEPIANFLDFVQNEHPINWNDIHHSQRHPNLYHDCRDTILLCEQNGLGGYTERPLMNASDLHIDHYRKKGMNCPMTCLLIGTTWLWRVVILNMEHVIRTILRGISLTTIAFSIQW